MIIFYCPKTLYVHHVMTLHPEGYADPKAPHMQGQSFIEVDETWPMDEIEVMPTNPPSLRRRQPMSLQAPRQAKAGVEFSITGVPPKMNVLVNETKLAEMDESGVVEFTAQNAGSYRFRFEGSGYITKDITIEVDA